MSESKQLPVRLPADVKTWLEDQATRNGSSQNSEIIRSVRERMDRTTQDQQSA
ncbi:MAG: Arc family DNA-binding protein [Pseudomonadota bacterium]